MGFMTHFERDDRLNERLLDVARQYHAPLPTPREEMWSAIAAGRQRRSERRRGLPIRWGLALAAVLVLGVPPAPRPRGGGRPPPRPPPPPPPSTPPPPPPPPHPLPPPN